MTSLQLRGIGTFSLGTRRSSERIQREDWVRPPRRRFKFNKMFVEFIFVYGQCHADTGWSIVQKHPSVASLVRKVFFYSGRCEAWTMNKLKWKHNNLKRPKRTRWYDEMNSSTYNFLFQWNLNLAEWYQNIKPVTDCSGSLQLQTRDSRRSPSTSRSGSSRSRSSSTSDSARRRAQPAGPGSESRLSRSPSTLSSGSSPPPGPASRSPSGLSRSPSSSSTSSRTHVVCTVSRRGQHTMCQRRREGQISMSCQRLSH